MPFYDFRCPVGHLTEHRAGFDQAVARCGCGETAERVAVNRIGFSGFAIPPMRERDVPLSRFVEAQGEMVETARRTGVQAPDVMAIAKRRAAQIEKYAPELVSGT